MATLLSCILRRHARSGSSAWLLPAHSRRERIEALTAVRDGSQPKFGRGAGHHPVSPVMRDDRRVRRRH